MKCFSIIERLKSKIYTILKGAILMNLKNYLFLTLVSTAIVGGTTITNAHAKYVGHNATPTEIRGTWYRYNGNNKWDSYKISKRSVKYNGKVIFSTSGKGSQKLHVKRYLKGKNYGTHQYKNIYGGTNYDLNSLAKYDYQKLGSFWLSHKKINGKRTLRFYLHQGVFNVLTKDKLKHNYTYQYNGANYMNQIGR